MVCRAHALDKAGCRSILSASKAPRLSSPSAGCRGRNLPGISARSYLGTEGDTSPSCQGEIRRRNPWHGRSGSSLSSALSGQVKPSSPSTPSHVPLGPFPVGWCLCGGRVQRAVPARPGVRGSSECQPCVTGTPSSLPAGIKLLLTWHPISFIAAPTFPPCQPFGRARRQRGE